jgi:hypothetical protein
MSILRPINTTAGTRHQSLLCFLGFFSQNVHSESFAFVVNVADERDTNNKCNDEKHEIDGHGVIAKDFVGQGIEGGLGEVEETGEADDETVYLAKGGEAEDFGRVVAFCCVSPKNIKNKK